jgi:DNA-binding NtrC family response regulator
MASILIVDDDPRISVLLKQLFKTKGYEAVSADSGRYALDLLKQNDFDLIITDLRMQHMNGMELLREVKALKPFIPVILVTAYASNETTIESVALGVFDYLSKPFKVDELLAAVERALATGKDKVRAAQRLTGGDAGQ